MIQISLGYHNLESYDKKFNRTSNCLTELYSRILEKHDYTIPKTKKIAIELIKNRKENLIIDHEGVISLSSNFELLNSSYDDAIRSKYERFKILFNGFLKIADKYSLAKTVLYQAYEECLSLDLKNEYYWGGPVYSKDKKTFAGLFCIHEEDWFACYLDIFESETNKLLLRKELAVTEPLWVIYKDLQVPIKTRKDSFLFKPKGDFLQIEVNMQGL